MPGELRGASEVASWLAVGLALRRIAAPAAREDDEAPAGAHPDDLVGRAIAACANELPALPPPGVIADIASLLAGGRLPLGAPSIAGEALQRAIRGYDDDVLARLVATPRFDDVIAAYAHAAAEDRAAAIALVVGAVCERAGFAGVAVSPAALRRALARWPGPRDATIDEELRGGRVAEQLASAYERLARGARQCPSLVDDGEVFAVDHLAVLRDLGSRMTAAHIGAAARAIARRLPRRLPARRALRGARETRLADDTLYPAGGFSAIAPGGATTGNLENLVTSELVYMEDDERIDLFSLRYVEGELLHYTRDDSVFRRHRHLIYLLLGPDLEAARIKDRGLPWQRGILALGLVVAAIRWLAEQLGDEALTVQVGCAPGVLEEERAILALLLEGEIARGTVELAVRPWADTLANAARAAGTAITDVVLISLGARPEIPRGLRVLHVELAGPAPRVCELAPRPGEPPDEVPDPWIGWGDAAEDLLRWLV